MKFHSMMMIAGTIVASALMTTDASAAAWTPPAGSTANFTYANGGDDYARFGSPTSVNGTGFTFRPQTFVASGANGSAAVTSDRMYVDIAATAQSGGITKVSLSEAGDYAIFNGGGANAFAYLLVHVNDANWVGNRNFTATLVATPTMPVTTTTNAFGAWTGDVTVTLPAAAQSVQIALNNVLQTYSAANGSALIEKKFAELRIVNAVIPEPTSAAALGGLAVLLLRRRRA